MAVRVSVYAANDHVRSSRYQVIAQYKVGMEMKCSRIIEPQIVCSYSMTEDVI